MPLVRCCSLSSRMLNLGRRLRQGFADRSRPGKQLAAAQRWRRLAFSRTFPTGVFAWLSQKLRPFLLCERIIFPHSFARLENPPLSGGILRVRFSPLNRALPVTAWCCRRCRELNPRLIPSGFSSICDPVQGTLSIQGRFQANALTVWELRKGPNGIAC